jgi:SAM-dependent methyltransferase
MKGSEPSVEAGRYTEGYYLSECGGAEFFARYGSGVLKPVLAYAKKRAGLSPGQKALDVGCGRGELLHHLSKEGVLAVGCDYALPALEIARKISQAPVLRCDAKALPFAEKAFDRILFLGVIDHLHDWELEACFREFARVLKPGGFVLANTCTNTDYYKNLTYSLRRRAARTLRLSQPRPPRSAQDEALHVNEHNGSGLRRFFQSIGWEGEIEFRPNERYVIADLYGEVLPEDFPLKAPSFWKSRWHDLSFRWPLRRFLARELFCKVSPLPKKTI